MGRWSISFRSSDFNGDDRRSRPKQGRHGVPDLTPQATGDGQHECPRGPLCASSTRDAEGVWHPLLVNSAFCPADESAIANALPDLPRSWFLLAARIGDPVRSGRGPRRPPGSRVLLNAEADALLRTSSAILMGWAARVRNVPGLQLSPNRHLPGKPEGVRDNCAVLAKHVTQMLALPPGPVVRTWTWPPGGSGSRPQSSSPCRRCGLPVSPSPSGKRWWPAVCAHTAVIEIGDPDEDGPRRLACAACSTRLPAGWPPNHCEHEAPREGSARQAPAPAGATRAKVRTQADVEDEIGDLEVIHAGDGWATVMTDLSGIDAGLEILDLAAKFRRMLGETPARPETLDGVPCRECEEIALVEAEPPHDPAIEKDKSKCTSCGARMTQGEYVEWTRMYDAWVKNAGPLICKFCREGDHGTCWWASCDCRRAGHARAA